MAANENTSKSLDVPLLVNQSHSCTSEKALNENTWVKLICGASNQDLPSITDLCAVYAAAGVHCIDVAADLAVVNAARRGLDWVTSQVGTKPWLMVSISDGKDVHFRKAWFDPKHCPPGCPRPCEQTCPAQAIVKNTGILNNLCYGCGRCIPSCPHGLINEKDWYLKLHDFGPLIAELRPDALEIHTAPGRGQAFESILEEVLKAKVSFKRIAVSCGLEGHATNEDELTAELWQRHDCLKRHGQKPLWQLDGRPMSGDIGRGTSRIAINLWRKLHSKAPPGPLQLAGGTNSQTINHLEKDQRPNGIAFGGMARKLIQPYLLEAQARKISLREWPEGWSQALSQAENLIQPWLSKSSNPKIC